MKRLALIAALLAGCGSTGDGDGRIGTGGSGLVGVDLESHCRAWCEPETGCDEGQGTPLQCLDSCLSDAERDPCFSHVVTYQQCVLDMECSDPFEDCEKPEGLSMPRGGGVPVCETIDNAYARCTCENLPDNGTGGTGGTGVTCDHPPASCFDPLFESDVLRTKLEGCAGDPVLGGCHLVANPTTMELDLTNPATTVEAALSPLVGQAGLGGPLLIDASCVGDSALLRKLTSDPGYGSRQPLSGDYWSNDEIECFRAYLTRTFMQ